jgi:hypothetical protein
MNPTVTITKEYKGGMEGLRMSNIDGVNFINVRPVHVWKYHNETPLCD